MFAGIISVVFTILVFIPYIAGVLRQWPGTTFAGVVHYSTDYYYYLSYLAQGKVRWFTSLNITTTEFKGTVLYHWFYILSGHIFSLFSISPIAGYEILIVAMTILLLFVSYRLICEVIPSRSGRSIAYMLYLLSNAFPYFDHTAAGWQIHYYSSWYNFGEPFIRFSSIPHNLLAQAITVTFLLVLAKISRYSGRSALRMWTLLLVLGFLLASTQTPLVLIVLLTYGIFWVKDIVSSHNPKRFLHAALSSPVFPALILLSAGAGPYMLYLRMLMQQPPYSTVVIWESAQQIHPSIVGFIQTNGPVVVLGLVNIPFFLYKSTRVRQILAVCTLVSWGLFFSPIPVWISILDVRFLSVIPTLTMACSASVLIGSIARRFRSFKPSVLIGTSLIVLAVTLPATVQQMISRTTFDPGNAYFFLPNTVFDAFSHAETLMKPQDTCIVIWPFYISYSGITGHREFIVNGYMTINYTQKEQQVDAFFSDETPLDQKTGFLTANNISCVITYSFTTHLPPVLTPAYANSYMTVYRMKK